MESTPARGVALSSVNEMVVTAASAEADPVARAANRADAVAPTGEADVPVQSLGTTLHTELAIVCSPALNTDGATV